jgi:hypothetical protein
MIEEKEGTVARALARGVTRRTAFQRAMRASLVVGGALAAPMAFFEGKASAAYCGPGGNVNYWGCECNPATNNCGSSNCSAKGNCGSTIRVRCNYWINPNADNNHCWCTEACNYGGGVVGYKSCCDCWKGNVGNCNESRNQEPCICGNFMPL